MEVAPEDSLLALEKTARQDFAQMDNESKGENERAEFVKEEDGAESSDLPGKADRPGEPLKRIMRPVAARTKNVGEQNRVEVSLREREANEVAWLFRAAGMAGVLTSMVGTGVFGV